MSEAITLHCVRERGKLRIRFHSFTNSDGKIYSNVYNNSYNCQFPRDIRQEGRFYQVGPDDINLIADGGRQPFYRIRKDNLRILPHGPNEAVIEIAPVEVVSTKAKSSARGRKKKNANDNTESADAAVVNIISRPAQVLEVTECVICMSSAPDSIFLPCAHMCACMGCYKDLKKHSLRPMCPLCRRTILNAIPNDTP
jgi:hypothetical protein